MARLTLVLATVLSIYGGGGARAQLGLTVVDVSVLEEHKVAYSAPVLQTKFQSASSFNARGMQHVYKISHTFLDLIHRKDVLPPSINHTVLINTPKEKVIIISFILQSCPSMTIPWKQASPPLLIIFFLCKSLFKNKSVDAFLLFYITTGLVLK